MYHNQACEKEAFANDEHDWLTNGSIRVCPKICILHFKTGRIYTYKIKCSNTTAKRQIIQIRPPDDKTFKFPDMPTVTISANESWNLQFTFMSHLNQEFKNVLHLKNPTGHGNLTVQLWALPKTHSSLPKNINFGNVDIAASFTKKLCLAPELKPYQFRIFIPHIVDGLSVNPTCGEVSIDSPTYITIVYMPQSYVTLCVDLVLYLSKNNEKPRVITITAVTKPKTSSIPVIKTEKISPKKIILPHPSQKTRKIKNDEAEKVIMMDLNRLALNKMLMNKDEISDYSYTWLNPMGESEKLNRVLYVEKCKKFMANAKLFGDEHKKTRFKTPRCEPFISDEEAKRVTDRRKVEWDMYMEKIHSYENILCDNQLESLGLREKSIRTNCIVTTKHDFNQNLDDNWWIRFQMYNKFVNAVNVTILKNRFEKRLAMIKSFLANNTINTL